MKTNNYQVDVVAILKKKFSWIPKFFFRPLKKFIHQDEFNYFLSHQCADKNGIQFVDSALIDCLHIPPENITVVWADGLPKDGEKYTFVCNHPLGGLDELITLRFLSEYYPNVKILLNDFLDKLPNLADYSAASDKLDLYSSDDHLIVFPENISSGIDGGLIQDVKWDSTFYTESLKNERGIVPIYFRGYNSYYYYRLFNFLKKLRKGKLAKWLLPREILKSKGKKYTIVIGEPIPYNRLLFLSKIYSMDNAVYLIKKMVYTLDRGGLH